MLSELKLGRYLGKDLYWIPVFDNDNIYILKEPICKMEFDKGFSYYYESDIRTFLTEQFFVETFTDVEKGQIMPNEKCHNDYVWLLDYFEIKNNKKHLNKKAVFKEPHFWWLRSQTGDNLNPGVNGAICRFALNADVSKSKECGVRPCIIWNGNGE